MTAGATLLLLAVAVSCLDPVAPEMRAELLPLGTAFTAVSAGGGNYTVSVPMRLVNTGRATIELDRCDPTSTTPIYFVDGGESGYSAYNPAWACTGGGDGLRVRPGEVRVDTLRFFGPTTSRYGVPFGSFEGRMVVSYYAGREYIASGAFQVSLPTP